MLIAYIPFFVLIVGILLWAFAGHALVKEIGRWMFIIGLFFTVQTLAQKTAKIGAATPGKVWRA